MEQTFFCKEGETMAKKTVFKDSQWKDHELIPGKMIVVNGVAFEFDCA